MRGEVQNGWGNIGKRLDELSDALRNKILPRTLNKVTGFKGARGRMATEVSAEYVISKREVNEQLRVDQATSRAGDRFMQARLYVAQRKGGRGFNLIRFVKGRRVVGGKGKPQLKFQIKRGGPVKSIPGAFIGNQGRTVFIREGKKRTPIKGITTIGIPQMFNTKRVNARVVAYIRERMPIVLEQEIKFATRQR